MKAIVVLTLVASTLALAACGGKFVRPDVSEKSVAERIMNKN